MNDRRPGRSSPGPVLSLKQLTRKSAKKTPRVRVANGRISCAFLLCGEKLRENTANDAPG